MRYDFYTRDNFGRRQGVRNNVFTTSRTTWDGGGRRTTRTSLFNWEAKRPSPIHPSPPSRRRTPS